MEFCLPRATDVVGAYSIAYFVLLVIFGAYFVVSWQRWHNPGCKLTEASC